MSSVRRPSLLNFLIVWNVGVYTKALSTGLIQKDIEQIVPIVLARAGAERRKAEADPEGGVVDQFQVYGFSMCCLIDQEAWVSLIKILEEGIAMVRAGEFSFYFISCFLPECLSDLCSSSPKSWRS